MTSAWDVGAGVPAGPPATGPGAARFEWANVLRGVASVSVLVFHLGFSFWMYQEVSAGLGRREPLYTGDTGAPMFARALSSVPFDLGGFGVGLFFMISGFVIAISIERYGRLGFLVGRAMRLLPTYAAGYLVTCAVIAVLRDPFDELSVQSVLVGAVPGLGFVLGVKVPADGIVWTLIVEIIFYGVCLVVFRSLSRRVLAIALVGAACVAGQLLIPMPALIVGSSRGGIAYLLLLACPFLPVMLVGATLSGIRAGHLSMRTGLLTAAGLTGLHAWLLATSPVVSQAVEYGVSFGAAIVVFTLVWWFGDKVRPRRVTTVLADLSYPLYVVHPVLGYATLSVLAARGVPPVLALLVALVIALATAAALHQLVEVPTHRWGRRWARALSPRPAVAGSPSPVTPAESTPA